MKIELYLYRKKGEGVVGMNWEQKLSAFQALTDTNVEMRLPGDWFVHSRGLSISSDDSCVLEGKYGNGRTPGEAVEQHWDIFSSVEYPQYCVVDCDGTRQHVRWNGFMWKNVDTRKLTK